jgi:hypothetical protein
VGEGAVKVYRVMEVELDGRPEVSAKMFGLGVRVRDIHPRLDGTVDPKSGGVSVSPTLESLPRAARTKDANAFELETEELPESLLYREDPRQPNRHGFIEPSYAMKFEHFHNLIRLTSELWSLM